MSSKARINGAKMPTRTFSKQIVKEKYGNLHNLYRNSASFDAECFALFFAFQRQHKPFLGLVLLVLKEVYFLFLHMVESTLELQELIILVVSKPCCL